MTNSHIAINGYNLLSRKDRTDTMDGRGGGILLYIKSELIAREIDAPSDIIQVAGAEIKFVDNQLNIFVVYWSPNSSLENNSRLNSFIKSIKENAVVVGDFNYPTVDWVSMTGSGPAREFLDAVNEKFLTQHVDFPTHDCGNILDLVLSNIPNRIHFFFL